MVNPNKPEEHNATTDFGFHRVPLREKRKLVEDIFNSVATKYDLMNDLMSFGIHRLWKRFTLNDSGVQPGQTVLDLAGGTGDLAAKFANLVGTTGFVCLADINSAMLKVGRDKLRSQGIISNVAYLQVDAESLPFANHYFDCVTVAFGLRNMTNKNAALQEIFRVLKPGGRLLILEFSKPIYQPVSKLYDLYSFYILPKMGKLVVQDSESYRYLAESIRMHPSQEELKSMMQEVGFTQVSYKNFSAGIVALHRGFKF